MIGLQQTTTGGPEAPAEERGDCLRACICSMLELPIEALPNFVAEDGDDWWGRLTAALRPLGWWEIGVALDPREDNADEQLEEWISPGFWLANVTSLNLEGNHPGTDRPLQHCVVMEGRNLAWDPALGRRYEIGTDVEDLDVWGVGWLIALDPAIKGAEPTDEQVKRVGDAMEEWSHRMHGIISSHRPGGDDQGREARKVIAAVMGVPFDE